MITPDSDASPHSKPLMTHDAETSEQPTSSKHTDYCARCRYPLTGLPQECPCPECGSTRRRHGNPSEASYTATVALARGVISAVILFLGPLAFAVLLLGPAASIAGVLALASSRRSFRQDGLPAIVGIVLGGGAFLALVGILAFAFFLTTP